MKTTTRPRWKEARGSVTAELAVVLPAVTVLLALLLLSVSVGMMQLRLEEGARAGARSAARGESTAQVMDVASRISGTGSSVSVTDSAGFVTVTVQGRVTGVLSGLLPWPQTAQASAKVETPAAATGLAVTAGEAGSHGQQ